MAEAVGLTARLTTLKELNSKRARGERKLSLQSVRHAVRFVQAHPTWPAPSLVITPHGTVQAYWRHLANGKLVAQFLPDGHVWFTVMNENGGLRLTGRVPMAEFEATAAAYSSDLGTYV